MAPVFLFGHEDLENAPEPGSVAETALSNRLRGALPLNLESLYITHADFVFDDKQAHIVKAFDILLQHKECVPHLRELVFEGLLENEDSIRRVGQVISIAEDIEMDARAVHLPHYTYVKERGWGWNEEVSFETCMHNSTGERVQVWPKPRWGELSGF